MRWVWVSAVALAGGLWLSGCETMSADQCLVGDWGGRGYQDGLNGLRSDLLDDHAKACAKHGVTPNVSAYYSAREQGLRQYCTPQSGYDRGRRGDSYNGVCEPADEGAFLAAYEDGRVIYEAEKLVADAESELNSAIARVRDREKKLDAKQEELRQDDLSREEREQIRRRIREVRDELERAHRDVRRAEDRLHDAEREARFILMRAR